MSDQNNKEDLLSGYKPLNQDDEPKNSPHKESPDHCWKEDENGEWLSTKDIPFRILHSRKVLLLMIAQTLFTLLVSTASAWPIVFGSKDGKSSFKRLWPLEVVGLLTYLGGLFLFTCNERPFRHWFKYILFCINAFALTCMILYISAGSVHPFWLTMISIVLFTFILMYIFTYIWQDQIKFTQLIVTVQVVTFISYLIMGVVICNRGYRYHLPGNITNGPYYVITTFISATLSFLVNLYVVYAYWYMVYEFSYRQRARDFTFSTFLIYYFFAALVQFKYAGREEKEKPKLENVAGALTMGMFDGDNKNDANKDTNNANKA